MTAGGCDGPIHGPSAVNPMSPMSPIGPIGPMGLMAAPLAAGGGAWYDNIRTAPAPPGRPHHGPRRLWTNSNTLSTADGPEAACRRLCDRLREEKDYHALFYALLMQKRHELGVSPVPTGPSKDLPASVHAPYEEAIRQAGRLVGNLYLQDGQLPQAWAYFRMLGEPGPVKEALEAHTPAEGDDVQSLVQIAYYEGVHPRKGFDWVLAALRHLQRHHDARRPGRAARAGGPAVLPEATGAGAVRGAARTAGGGDRAARRQASRRRPTRPRGAVRSEADRGPRLAVRGRRLPHRHVAPQFGGADEPWTCRRARNCDLTRELCAYGKRLSSRFRHRSEPPFEDMYEAYDKYLAILTGEDVEGGVAYYREQAEKAEAEGERHVFGGGAGESAVAAGTAEGGAGRRLRKYLMNADGRRLTCPGVAELAPAGRRLPDAGRGGAARRATRCISWRGCWESGKARNLSDRPKALLAADTVEPDA